MEKHITILGSLYVAWGALGALAALCLVGVLISGEFIPLETTTICYVVAGCIALLSTLEIVGGVALLQRRSWARILVLVLGFLNLICIPIGTALGIYTIWVLMKDETAQLFGPGTKVPDPVSIE